MSSDPGSIPIRPIARLHLGSGLSINLTLSLCPPGLDTRGLPCQTPSQSHHGTKLCVASVVATQSIIGPVCLAKVCRRLATLRLRVLLMCVIGFTQPSVTVLRFKLQLRISTKVTFNTRNEHLKLQHGGSNQGSRYGSRMQVQDQHRLT